MSSSLGDDHLCLGVTEKPITSAGDRAGKRHMAGLRMGLRHLLLEIVDLAFGLGELLAHCRR